MTPTTIAETILADVPRYASPDGNLLAEEHVLARIAAMEAQIKGLEGGIEAACNREAETERKLRTALAASETHAEAAETALAAMTKERDYADGTNEVLRGENQRLETALAAERAKTAKLVEAGRALQADMLERARIGTDAIHGEEYRIVNAGRTAWADFCAAIEEAAQ